ncbi:MAG: hypothetical protein L0Z50_15075 [Verrucomicrobiales bacterium]|nr:hypothetical protein [Verrucomicrobiales bacterium]
MPALAVVVSGSSVGDPRQMDKAAGLVRANEIILNGFGRAGRPGFSNQSVVVLVSDKPFNAPIVASLDPGNVLKRYPVLGEPDASVSLSSKIEGMLDQLHLSGQVQALGEIDGFSSLLFRPAGSPSAGKVVASTFGAFMRRKRGTPVQEHTVDAVVEEARTAMTEVGAPAWLAEAAMSSGTSVGFAMDLWRAYENAGGPGGAQEAWTPLDWFDAFVAVMKRLPVNRVQKYLAPDGQKGGSVRTVLRDLAGAPEGPDWDQRWSAAWDDLAAIIRAYLEGSTYRFLASRIVGIPEKDVHGRRSAGDQPIPAVFKFLREVVDFGLALDAGCFVAIHQRFNAGASVPVPDALAALPLCIRNGCHSLSTLAWFRFGLRQRVCAHAFAEVFPVPEELADDVARRKWVRDTRSVWLQDEWAIDPPLLAAARSIITSGDAL